MLLGEQEADAVPDDEEIGPLHLPNQPQNAAVVDEQHRTAPSVAVPVVSDAELTDCGFNDENKSSGDDDGRWQQPRARTASPTMIRGRKRVRVPAHARQRSWREVSGR